MPLERHAGGERGSSRAMRHVLILSAGRRVSLLEGFEAAARPHGLRVLAADAVPGRSAACARAEAAFSLPRVGQAGWADALIDLCRSEEVGLIVPTIDTELPALAKLAPRLAEAGAAAVVSAPDLIETFADKRRTARFFEEAGVAAPRLYRPDGLPFPVFVKPYDGSLSAGARLLSSAAEATPEILGDPRNIFCEYADPAEYAEFTCDLYYDRKGSLRCAVPRERLEVRGGEVSKARTARLDITGTLFERFGAVEGARGVLTLQLFRHRETGRMLFNEVNARFGGGYPLSRLAGADCQSWLIREYLLGEEVPVFDQWEEGLVMLRYDAEMIVRS